MSLLIKKYCAICGHRIWQPKTSCKYCFRPECRREVQRLAKKRDYDKHPGAQIKASLNWRAKNRDHWKENDLHYHRLKGGFYKIK